MTLKFVRVLPFLLVLAASAANQPAAYIESTKGDAEHWAGLKWSAEDTALFGGVPVYQGTDTHLILVRNFYFVSDYDVDRLTPLWVAHVDEQDSEAKDKARTTGVWSRKGDRFEPDANVVAYSRSLNLPFVTDASYTAANPPQLPEGDKNYAKVTRGHMASNQEMKADGDDTTGVESQHQSFSLANVVPQLEHNNAPVWAALETDCLLWAAKIGRVAVITGPVYAPDDSMPPPVNKVIYTQGKDGVRIPIPTHLFKIIIGRIDGKLAAVGFLVPHLTTLPKEGYRQYAVPIADIEKAAHLTFFAGATTPPDKTEVDSRWLAMLPTK